MTTRRTFLRVAGTSAVILAAGGYGLTQCDPMPEVAVEAWRGPAPNARDPRVRALSYALLAPNPHNKQPWLVDLKEPGAATLYCDRSRVLPQTDPFARQITVGCGAFLELLRMASAEQGLRAEISAFPAGDWPENAVGEQPVCRVAFVPDAAVARDPLLAQVLKRRTNRNAFDAMAVSPSEAAAIGSALQALPVRFGWTADERQIAQLAQIAKRAWDIEVKNDATFKESVDVFRITGPEIAKHRDGISLHGPFFWWADKLGLFTKQNAMEPSGRAQALTLIDPQLAVRAFGWIVTAANDRRAQLAAGAAYVRANLKATELGLAMHPLSQALQEFPEMLPLLAEHKRAVGAVESETVQMFFRLGRAALAEPAPRRPLDAIIRS
ncbi:MAG: twin-arginine translocation pathway signal protein [Alphaproteobacteria bacterium]|nr:twin-arginine translocation pathway signal protein [Alphaproteobacteria bacterium]